MRAGWRLEAVMGFNNAASYASFVQMDMRCAELIDQSAENLDLYVRCVLRIDCLTMPGYIL